MKFLLLMWVVAAGFISESAYSRVFITNLTKKNVYVSRYAYYRPTSSSGGLQVYTPGGWTFNGWYTLVPGDTYRSEHEWFHVSQNARPIQWPQLQESRGLIKRGGDFKVSVEEGSENEQFKEKVRQGYELVDYQKMSNKKYQVDGDGFRITEKSFPFDIESRSIKFITETFDVPGRIVDFNVTGDSWGAKGINWQYGKNEKSVSLTGSVEGAQKKPFGPREPGYIKGNLRVFYTVPR